MIRDYGVNICSQHNFLIPTDGRRQFDKLVQMASLPAPAFQGVAEYVVAADIETPVELVWIYLLILIHVHFGQSYFVFKARK